MNGSVYHLFIALFYFTIKWSILGLGKPLGYGNNQNIYIVDSISCYKKVKKKILVIKCVYIYIKIYVREAQAWVIKFIHVWMTISAL